MVCDEAHKTAVEGVFSRVLEDEFIPQKIGFFNRYAQNSEF